MSVLETDIEKKCKGIAEKHGCLYLKIQKIRGYPDRILLAPNGKICFVEFKKPGEPLMPFQKHIQSELRRMNFLCEEVDNFSLFLSLVLKLKDSSPTSGNLKLTKKEVSNG
jgi:hypothetical protein